MRLQLLINILIMRGQSRGQLSLSLPKSPFKRSHRQALGFWKNSSLSVFNRSQRRSYTVQIPCYSYHVVVLERSRSFRRYHEVSDNWGIIWVVILFRSTVKTFSEFQVLSFFLVDIGFIGMDLKLFGIAIDSILLPILLLLIL